MLTHQKLSRSLKELREERGWSQEQLAKELGISRVAVSDIENNKRILSALELAKASEVLGIPIDTILGLEHQAFPRRAPSTSEVAFNSEKLKNTLLAILELCGGKPNVGETVLYKLLYFIDFGAYEQIGNPVTGLSYVKLQYGPVPASKEYLPVVEAMQVNGVLKIIQQNYYGKIQKRYVALQNSDPSCFSAKELLIIGQIVEQLSHLSAAQIEEYAHHDVPWEATGMKEVIPYALAFERRPPYSQIDWERAFADSGTKDILKELGPLSKEEADYYNNL